MRNTKIKSSGLAMVLKGLGLQQILLLTLLNMVMKQF